MEGQAVGRMDNNLIQWLSCDQKGGLKKGKDIINLIALLLTIRYLAEQFR